MPTRAEERDLKHGGSGGKHEPYQLYGQHAGQPAFERMKSMSGGFGGQYSGAFGLQRDMYNQYGQMAAGQGPSLAQAQLQQGMGAASQAATQQMLQARGGNAAGGQLGAATIGSSMGGQAAMNAAALRQNEQMMAMSAQGQLAGQMAGQSLQGQLGMEGLYQGALGNQLAADVQYRLGARGLREQERMGHNQRVRGNVDAATLGLGGGDLLSDMRAKQNVSPTTGAYAGYQNPGLAQAGDEIGNSGEAKIGLGSILGIAGLLSDERAKQNVVPGNLQASDAMSELQPISFEYKAGYGPGGRRFGVAAQDMQRAYPQAVIDTPQGMGIDVPQGLGLNLAATAEHERRLRELEGRQHGAFA